MTTKSQPFVPVKIMFNFIKRSTTARPAYGGHSHPTRTRSYTGYFCSIAPPPSELTMKEVADGNGKVSYHVFLDLSDDRAEYIRHRQPFDISSKVNLLLLKCLHHTGPYIPFPSGTCVYLLIVSTLLQGAGGNKFFCCCDRLKRWSMINNILMATRMITYSGFS